MEEEHSGSSLLGSPLRPLLTYGVPYVGAGVWAFTRFPEQLRWTSDVFARFFGLAAPFYEDIIRVEGYGDALDAAIDALEREPIRVLDLCCGTGFAARQIQHAFPDAEVVGIDLSPEMVLMARREADEEGLDIEFEVDDARALKLEDESFDLVVSHNAPPFPDETMRVLGPSGTLLTVWSFGGPWVGLAWPALAKRLRKANALHTDGHRAGPGFYAIAEKSGIRRRRHIRANGSVPPEPAGARRESAGPPQRTSARRATAGTRPAAPARGTPAKASRPARGAQVPPEEMPTLAKRPTPKTAKPAKPARGAQVPPEEMPTLAKRPTPKAAKAAKAAARRSSAKPSAPSSGSSRRGRGPAARPGAAETPPERPS